MLETEQSRLVVTQEFLDHHHLAQLVRCQTFHYVKSSEFHQEDTENTADLERV
jgi:hypothetical protein